MLAEDAVFMIPGPVKIHPRVLRAMTVQAVNHRGPEFKEVNGELRELLRYLFQDPGEVALLTGSGTAGLEAAVASLVRREDRVLNLINGKFSERFHEISQVFAKPTALEVPFGKAVDPQAVAAALEKGEYRAVTMCHNETSTGLTNPLKEIGTVVRKHGAFLIVDGITSVGGLEVRPATWGVDVLVTGSQKCIAAPAGLAPVWVSPRAYEALHGESSFYLNLRKHVDELNKDNNTPWTPAIPLFFALREALRMLKEEGLPARIERTAKLGGMARAAVDALGLTLFADRRFASNTVTAMVYPPGVDDAAFRKELKETHKVIVAGGQGQMKGKIFRIGHMGICSSSDLVATFSAFETVLAAKGKKVTRGAAAAAIGAA